MVGGQVNPVISVIMDNNNSDYWTYLDKKEIIWFLRVILMMAHAQLTPDSFCKYGSVTRY